MASRGRATTTSTEASATPAMPYRMCRLGPGTTTRYARLHAIDTPYTTRPRSMWRFQKSASSCAFTSAPRPAYPVPIGARRHDTSDGGRLGGREVHRGVTARTRRAGPHRRLLAGGELPVRRADLPAREPVAAHAARAGPHQAPPARPLGHDAG